MTQEKPIKPDKERRFVKRMALSSKDTDKGISVNLRRAYILPTQKGLYYLATLVIMFIWTVNYALSLGYAMTFFAAIFAMIVAHLTVGNLSSIRIKPLENPTFFAGDPAYFRLRLDNNSAEPKVQIRARRNGVLSESVSLAPHDYTECHVILDDTSRGRKLLEYVRLSADYPIGIFSTWTWLNLDSNVLIYPRPEGDLPLPFLPAHHSFDEGEADLHGSEDFDDIRDYQPGDNLRHVLWKKMSHGGYNGDKLRVKTFRDLAGQQCVLDFNDNIIKHLDTESRLSQLCAWVLAAENSGTRYALNLPNQNIASGIGSHHQSQCLEALACY